MHRALREDSDRLSPPAYHSAKRPLETLGPIGSLLGTANEILVRENYSTAHHPREDVLLDQQVALRPQRKRHIRLLYHL